MGLQKLYNRIVKHCVDFNEYELMSFDGSPVNYIAVDYMKIRTMVEFNRLWVGHPNAFINMSSGQYRRLGYVVSGRMGSEGQVIHDSHRAFETQDEVIDYLNSL